MMFLLILFSNCLLESKTAIKKRKRKVVEKRGQENKSDLFRSFSVIPKQTTRRLQAL